MNWIKHICGFGFGLVVAASAFNFNATIETLNTTITTKTEQTLVPVVIASLNSNISSVTAKNCGVWDELTKKKAFQCSFWMEGVLLCITGLFGLMGNTISVIILSKPKMRNSFNQLLITLSTMDSIFIVLALIDYSFARAFKGNSILFIYLFPFIIYPLNNISFCASIFTTVALAYERYIAVCKPLHYRDMTTRLSVKRRTLSYVIPVIILSILLNIPKFMETKFVWKVVPVNKTSNETLTKLGLGVSDLRSNPDYIRFYINWTRLLTTGVIPMAFLVFFNWSIFRGIRMTHERTRKRNKQKASEMNLAAILLCIVMLFLICHLPRILLNVHELIMLEDMLSCGKAFTPPVWFLCFTSFNHWLLIVNASFNFLIYCSVGTGFKEVIASICNHSILKKCCTCMGDIYKASEIENNCEQRGGENMEMTNFTAAAPAVEIVEVEVENGDIITINEEDELTPGPKQINQR